MLAVEAVPGGVYLFWGERIDARMGVGAVDYSTDVWCLVDRRLYVPR